MSEEEIPKTAKHYSVCDIEKCKNYCQFYCIPCHLQLCEQCSYNHWNSLESKNHELAFYPLCTRQLPEEKCKLHPTRNLYILCKHCNSPLCTKCMLMEDHSSHQMDDLENHYLKKVAFCQIEISKIQEYFLPTSQDLKKDIDDDISKLKDVMIDIRNSIKAEAESLKKLVDIVALEKVEQAVKIEDSLLNALTSQKTTYDEYIADLENVAQEFHSYMSSTNVRDFFPDQFAKLKIEAIPEAIQLALPSFTNGNFKHDDVFKLLGDVKVNNNEQVKRKIKSQSFSVTKVKEFTVPGVGSAFHVSIDKTGRLWVSDDDDKLVQIDLQGNQLQKEQTSGSHGYHTVTKDNDLLYTVLYDNVITRVTLGNERNDFIKTGGWAPISIYASQINEDILVGMIKVIEVKVTRYNRTGEEIQNIQKDNKGHELYNKPHYITENINGDICTSDIKRQAVVVVDKSGHHRFSYTGQGPEFRPYGICVDFLGHIIVCDGISNTIDILNQDGQFLSLLLTQRELQCPRSVCVDVDKTIYIGQCDTNIVSVFKYLL